MADMSESPSDDEYEIVPYREISELKRELAQLRDVPIPTTKKLQVSMDDLADKLSRLTAIFEAANHELRVEEGGLSFQEKMKPLMEKMNKILEQNSEIAKGIVALADIVSDLKDRMEKGFLVKDEAKIDEHTSFMNEPQPLRMPMMGQPPLSMPPFTPPPLPSASKLPPPLFPSASTLPDLGALPSPPQKRKGFF